MMVKLYEVADQYAQALDMLENPEMYEKFNDTLEAIDENFKDKLDSIGKLRQSKLAEAAMLKEEAKRLKEKADKAEKEAQKLADYVDYTMRKHDFKKLETPFFKFSYRSSTSLVVTDMEQIPEHFLKPQPPKPDVAGMKKYIKQYYEERELEVPEDLTETLGVKFEKKDSLQIK